MRRNLDISLVLVVSMAAFLLLPATQAHAESTKPVKVNVKCPKTEDAKFTITVDPYEIVVDQGDSIEWQLDNDNKKNEFVRISAKDDDHWLFPSATKKENKKVLMTGMLPNSDGKTFHYKIKVYCGDMDHTDPVVLDPRIKVGGG